MNSGTRGIFPTSTNYRGRPWYKIDINNGGSTQKFPVCILQVRCAATLTCSMLGSLSQLPSSKFSFSVVPRHLNTQERRIYN